MSITPDALEQEFSLTTAVTRLDFLSRRDSEETASDAAGAADGDEDDWSHLQGGSTSLDVAESLELLALGEVVARRARDSRLVGFRAALRGGASWELVAAALGVTPAEAWTAYHRLIDEQEQARALDAQSAAAARDLAGSKPGG
ncbi:hypothetical protein [Geodermatophilus ruber]|uniref:Uncharacterized protein n=1 Tax=Geodermatophilus ruber TaxID=504800 RepID=A0A1I4HFH1_9ACTN|nr:hypothetical protein [Geodermatophilus ruber]SFL40126.1 hypothetical protein SAMN04488085_110149 [Geodermatophilus ruber]